MAHVCNRSTSRRTALERHQPPRTGHARHGRHGALLRGRARHAPRRDDDGRPDAALLLRDGPTATRSRSSRCPGAETFAKPAGGPSDRAIQLDHISFNVPDENSLEMLRKRLLAAGSEVTRWSTTSSSAPSTSPTRTASRWRRRGGSWTATGRPADTTDAFLFSDPDPVPAIEELSAGGIRGPARRPDSPDAGSPHREPGYPAQPRPGRRGNRRCTRAGCGEDER